MANVDFKNEEEVKRYIENIGIEYRFSCYNEKKTEACHLLGMYFENIKKDYEKAKRIYKVNCDTYGWSFSCHRYAYLRENQLDRKIIDQETIDYFCKGCESEPECPPACHLGGLRLGRQAETIKDIEEKKEKYNKAIKYMEKACNWRLGQACFNLSSIYFDGIPAAGIPKSMQKVHDYSLIGCDNLQIECCINLSVLFSKGEGGFAKDPEKAQKYKLKAHELYKQMTSKGLSFEEGIK